jgi:hypothetical protein
VDGVARCQCIDDLVVGLWAREERVDEDELRALPDGLGLDDTVADGKQLGAAASRLS